MYRLQLHAGSRSRPRSHLDRKYSGNVPTCQRRSAASTRTRSATRRRRKHDVQRRPARRGSSVTVLAPVPPRKGRRVLSFTAASDRDVPAFLGTTRLACTPESVDLERLRNGILSLCVDHIQSLLIGRITSATIGGGVLDMQAEVSDTPYARRIMEEFDDMTRAGFSPAFLINNSEMLPESDPSFDSDLFQTVVTSFTPYEVSSCACPRNPTALLKGESSMSMNANLVDKPELVSVDDPIGLGLSAGRMAMRSGQGTERQRVKLEAFFAVYDKLRAQGQDRDAAALAAKEAAGLA